MGKNIIENIVHNLIKENILKESEIFRSSLAQYSSKQVKLISEKLNQTEDLINTQIQFSSDTFESIPKKTNKNKKQIIRNEEFVLRGDMKKYERFYFNKKDNKILIHSDYFIDFINENFGKITNDLNFKRCLDLYEMYNDVVDYYVSNNFKRRFRLEKRKLQGFSN